jgi:hypothetical protein
MVDEVTRADGQVATVIWGATQMVGYHTSDGQVQDEKAKLQRLSTWLGVTMADTEKWADKRFKGTKIHMGAVARAKAIAWVAANCQVLEDKAEAEDTSAELAEVEALLAEAEALAPATKPTKPTKPRGPSAAERQAARDAQHLADS